jgi:hypothetical protein
MGDLKKYSALPETNTPIVEMFWVAEYNNGKALPQFNPFTGEENSFSKVDHKSVIRFWWLPISYKMSFMFKNTRHNPKLKSHHINLKGSKGFVARRVAITVSKGFRVTRIKCYVLGIENGPRVEIYPNGAVVNVLTPSRGESQDILHS